MRASGGNPTREWSVTSGSLPAGLTLDSFSGAIAGVATEAGTFPFTVRVRDSATAAGGSSATSITIDSGLLSVDEDGPSPRFDAIVPNPTNGPATLRFRLPRAGNVSLEIFSVAGRRVARLASGHVEAGSCEVRRDGDMLAPGLYLCRLEAGGFSGTRKLVVRE